MAESKKAEVEVVDVEDENVLNLSKPLPNGADKLIFDFDKLNGYTLIACEKRAKKEDNTIMVPSLSQVYQAYVAAAAAGVKVDDIFGLNANDFTAACIKAQGFLLGAGR